MIRIDNINHPKKKVLFLGYDQTQTTIIDALIANECAVDHTQDIIDTITGYDYVISYDMPISLNKGRSIVLGVLYLIYTYLICHIIVVLIQIFGRFMTILLVVSRYI